MEIRVPKEELQKRSIFLGLPCYGGMMAANCAKALMNLSTLCTQHGIGLNAYFLSNESLITRARSYIAEIFLQSGATHLMFIDSDIGFDAKDVLTLLALQSEESPYDVIGACYPKKTISWEKIKAAVDAGKADEDPGLLEMFAADFVFNPKPGVDRIPLNEPAEVMEIGTGFMMVRRKAFQLFDEKFPEYKFTPDHVRSKAFDGHKQIMLYFQAEIDKKTNRYLSEDYFFCQKIIEAGGRIWLCPWMQLEHMGSYFFKGSLHQLASIGASATADPTKLKHKK